MAWIGPKAIHVNCDIILSSASTKLYKPFTHCVRRCHLRCALFQWMLAAFAVRIVWRVRCHLACGPWSTFGFIGIRGAVDGVDCQLARLHRVDIYVSIIIDCQHAPESTWANAKLAFANKSQLGSMHTRGTSFNWIALAFYHFQHTIGVPYLNPEWYSATYIISVLQQFRI